MTDVAEVLKQSTILVIPVQPDSKIRYKSEKRQEPTLIQKWRDPYWRHYASFWMMRARDIYREQMNVRSAKNAPISLDDRDAIDGSFRQIKEFAKSYTDSVSERDLEAARYRAMRIRRFVVEFGNLTTDSNVRANQALGLERRLKGFRTLARKRRLQNTLQYALRHVHACNKAARKATFRNIATWIGHASKENSIFWLHGEPGCGKTVITNCFAQACATEYALSASYTFEVTPPTSGGLSHIETFVTNLIADIGDYLGKSFQCILSEIAAEFIGEDDELLDDFLTKPFATQVNMTLIPAWNRLTSEYRKPLIVILDGIERIQHGSRESFLTFMKIAVETLPILLFVSSNNDREIEYHMVKGILVGKVANNELPKYDPNYWVNEPTSPTDSDFNETFILSDHDFGDDEPTPKMSHSTFSQLQSEATLGSGSKDHISHLSFKDKGKQPAF